MGPWATKFSTHFKVIHKSKQIITALTFVTVNFSNKFIQNE